MGCLNGLVPEQMDCLNGLVPEMGCLNGLVPEQMDCLDGQVPGQMDCLNGQVPEFSLAVSDRSGLDSTSLLANRSFCTRLGSP